MKVKTQDYYKLTTLYLVPALVYAFTFSLPLLHLTNSRVYNFRVAVVEFLIISIAFAIYRKELLIHFKKQNVDTLLIYLFFLSGLISTLNSDFLNYSAQRYTSTIIWFAYFWLVVFLIRNKYLQSSTLIFVISISTLIPIIHLLVIYSHTESYNRINELTDQLYYYSNIRHFGYHLTSVALISFYFLMDRKVTHYKFLLGATLISTNLAILFWTASRQGIVICFIFGLLLYLFIFKNNSLRKNLLILSFLLFFISLMIYLAGIDPLVINRLLTGIEKAQDLNAFFGGRASLWDRAFKSINYNWFFGIGPESFSHLKEMKVFGGNYIQPHSIIFQAITSWGLIGYLLLFSIFGRLLFIAGSSLMKIKTSDNKNLMVISSTLISSIFFNATIDGTLYHALPIYIFSIMSAILVAETSIKPRNHP